MRTTKKIACALFSVAAIAAVVVALADEKKNVGLEPENVIIKHLDSLHRLATGYGSTALGSPFGRYLLLRHNDEILAIKIIQHSSGLSKSQYEWVWLRSEKQEEGVGWLSENESQEPDFVVIHSFNVKWSSGDWFYFDKSGLEMARTEIVDKEKIKKLVETPMWFTKESLERAHEGTIAMFRQSLKDSVVNPSGQQAK